MLVSCLLPRACSVGSPEESSRQLADEVLAPYLTASECSNCVHVCV